MGGERDPLPKPPAPPTKTSGLKTSPLYRIGRMKYNANDLEDCRVTTDVVKCILCPEGTHITRPGYGKHLCSKTHEEYLQTALRNLSSSQRKKLTDYSELPCIQNRLKTKEIYVCFGCKGAWAKDDKNHLKSCKFQEQHLKRLQALITVPGAPEPEPEPEPVIDMEYLLAENARLKEENELLKKRGKAKTPPSGPEIDELKKQIAELTHRLKKTQEDVRSAESAEEDAQETLKKYMEALMYAVGTKGDIQPYSTALTYMNELIEDERPFVPIMTQLEKNSCPPLPAVASSPPTPPSPVSEYSESSSDESLPPIKPPVRPVRLPGTKIPPKRSYTPVNEIVTTAPTVPVRVKIQPKMSIAYEEPTGYRPDMFL